MSNTAEKVWNLYKDLSDSEEEFTVNDNINERKEESNYNIITLHPYCNKCNKFHKKENNCKLKGTISV